MSFKNGFPVYLKCRRHHQGIVDAELPMVIKDPEVEVIQKSIIRTRGESVNGRYIRPFQFDQPFLFSFVQIAAAKFVDFDEIVMAVVPDDGIIRPGATAIGEDVAFSKLH